MSQGHHVIPKQRIKQRISDVAIKVKQNRELTAAERRLLDTALTTVLDDRRNIFKIANALHHRAHNGVTPHRLKPEQLPRGIHDFAEEYALEGALERELRLMDG